MNQNISARIFKLFLYFMPLTFLAISITGCDTQNCGREYWVATDGNDSGNGDVNNPFLTIERARNAVRENVRRGTCPMTVTLKAGTYRLSAPLVLDERDSGGAQVPVVYRAAPGAQVFISGAERVTGWTTAGDLVHPTILKAQTTINTTTMPRQLYVNGMRAVRARMPNTDYPDYYTPGTQGYKYLPIFPDTNPSPSTWTNITSIEAVTATQWKMMRCPVSEIQGGTNIIMQTPCWKNANVFPSPWNFHLLNWWENAYEFLDTPGEWYLNPVTKFLYYMPRTGEDPSTFDVELPVIETLIQGDGTLAAPVSYINFENLNFSYATWFGPSTSDGYALDQSGFHLVGPNHAANTIGHDPNDVRTPGNLSFIYAQNISFLNNTFSHMGAVALDFGTGSQGNQIVNNTFTDISAAAIQLGGIDVVDHHPTYVAQLTKDNRIANNLVEYTGQEYYDAPGIYIGFTTRSLVEHNTIQHTSWSGIAIGWGWGLLDPGGFPGLPHATPYEWGVYNTPSAAHQNKILNNKIQYFLEKLWDGGAIYSTGFQGTSLEDGQLIAGNVALDKRASAGGNTFYTDGGSRYNTLRNNVSLNNPQGTMDFGPCFKASSFQTSLTEGLCFLTGVFPYGADMGGCVPYGDMVFENNYLRDRFAFYDICTNAYVPNVPINMTFINNSQVTNSNEVPGSILQNAGRQ